MSAVCCQLKLLTSLLTIGLLTIFSAGASAAERDFTPNLSVEISPTSDPLGDGSGQTAGTTPGVKVILDRDGLERPIKDMRMVFPERWRDNGSVVVDFCAMDDIGIGRIGRTDCPEGSVAAEVNATIGVEFTGRAYFVDPVEYYRENPDWAAEYGVDAEDLLSPTTVPLPLVIVLRGPLGEAEIPVVFWGFMYARAGDHRIVVEFKDMARAQTGLTKLVMDMPGAVDGPQEPEDPGTIVGVLRTPPTPDTCSRPHEFEIFFESHPDPQGETVTRTVRPAVDLQGCDQISFPYRPQLEYQIDTTQANVYSTASMQTSREQQMAYTKTIRLVMAENMWASMATPVCYAPNMEAEKPEDVCPAETLVGTVEMETSLFDNHLPIVSKGFIFNIPTQGLDVATFGIAAHLPPIVSNEKLFLPVHASTYGPGLNGFLVDSEIPLMEFDIRKIRFDFGLKLLNPSDCNERKFTAQFGSEIPGLGYTMDLPFTPTGCENLRYNPQSQVEVSDTRPGSVPSVTINTSQQEGEATTRSMKATLRNWGINMKTNVQPCSSADFDHKSCGESAMIGTVFGQTTLLRDPLRGRIYLADPAEGDAETVKRILVELQGPPGFEAIEASLVGVMAQDKATKEYQLIIDDMPSFPLTNLSLQINDLMSTSDTCGPSEFITQMTSYAGHQVELRNTVPIEGKGCEPWLSGTISSGKGNRANLKLAVKPNRGEGYNKLRQFTVALGGNRKSISALKIKKKGRKKASKKAVGLLRLTTDKGKGGSVPLVRSGKGGSLRPTAKARGKVGALSSVVVRLKDNKIFVTGLAGGSVKEVQLKLDGQLKRPKQCKPLLISGSYLLASGKRLSGAAKASVSCSKKKK